MLTKGHFEYLRLENLVTIEVLAGRLSEREADHELRSARQVLGYLSEQSTQQPGDRVAPCSRCGECQLLEFYIHSDSLDLLVCRACGEAAQALAAGSSSSGAGHIVVKKVA
jgi:hypothetical protein